MNKDQVNVVLSLLHLVSVYGIPAIQKAIENMDKEVITKDDVDNLKISSEWDGFFKRS